MKLVWVFVCLLLWVAVGRADNRLWVAARINGKPAYLIFDTGAERTVLFKKSADRFGLETIWRSTESVSVSNAPTFGVTDEGLLEFGKASLRTWFQVMTPPAYIGDVKGDGVMGWSTFDVDLLQIDAENSIVRPITKLPRNIGAYQRLTLRGGTRILAFEAASTDGKPSYLYLDTGAEFGVSLSPTSWREWRAMHINQPVNVEWYYLGYAGHVISEQAWADQLTLGSIALTSVPILEANAGELVRGSPGYMATLGVAALRRLDVIIDRPHGCAYVRPKTTPPPPYDHNRTGVAIEPKDSGQFVIARVVKGSPGDEAGVGAGDVLLKIEDRDVSNWHSAPFSQTTDSSELPAGTRLNLTLEREGAKFTTTLVLRDLIGPSSGPIKSGRSRPGPSLGRTNDFSRFKVAIRLWPPDAGDYNRRAFLYESNGRLDDAISNYSRAIQLDAASSEAHGFRGRCFAKKGEFERAVRDLQAAISLQPTNEAAEVELGYVSCLQSNWESAITAYSEAVRLNPSKVDNRRRRAAAYEAKGDLQKAIEDYSYVIQLDPKATNAYYDRGRCYFNSGDVDLAIGDYKKAVALNPSSAEIYEFRGYAYAQHGELYLAVSDLNEAIRLRPTNAWAYGMRGDVNARRREWEKAIHDFAEAIRLDPKNPAAYRKLAWLEATCPQPSLRNGAAAVRTGRKACELTDWKDAWALRALAAASAEVGDFENAVKYEQQVLALDGLSEQERKTTGERLLLYQEHKPFHQPARQ